MFCDAIFVTEIVYNLNNYLYNIIRDIRVSQSIFLSHGPPFKFKSGYDCARDNM